MDFDLSEEQRSLVQSTQRFVREHLGLEARRAATTAGAPATRAHWPAFAELGWLALLAPENAGGLGRTDVDLALVMEELGRGLAAEAFADTVLLGVTLIAASRDGALRSRLLDQVLAGDCRTALAHVEGKGRSEYETTVVTRAERSGERWRVTGAKTRVYDALGATHWLVTARVPERPAPWVFVVAAEAPGASTTTYPLIDGTRAADIVFDGVTATPLLVDEHAEVLELALDRMLVATSAACLGSMEAVMAMTADYLKQRVQYGQPLASFQALQHRMAEMFIETEQARGMLLGALAALESGDPARRGRAASGAKWLVTRAGYFVMGQGIQLHGGIGVTEEYATAHHYKSMVVYDQRFGDADFHLGRSNGLARGIPG